MSPRGGVSQGKMTNMGQRRLRRTGHIGAWLLVGVFDLAAVTHTVPWLPTQLHTLAVGSCLALTVKATWARYTAPVEAAFLHGKMLAEENAARAAQVEARPGGGTGTVVGINEGRRSPYPSLRPSSHRRAH